MQTDRPLRIRLVLRAMIVASAALLGATAGCAEESAPGCGPGEVLVGDVCRPATRAPADPGRPGAGGRDEDRGPGERPGASGTPGNSSEQPSASDPHSGTDAPPPTDSSVPPGTGTPQPDPTDTPTPSAGPPPPPPPPENPCGPGHPGTSISGVVNIPSGTLPLPDVSVYIPRGELFDIQTGADCNPCGGFLSGIPVVEAITNTEGRFQLMNVPPGQDIPLVIEVGKWRRAVVIPEVRECEDNILDPELTRLPRNQQEGSLPQFAVTTGGWDALECLLRKIGISDSEFTPADQGGRVHLYSGRGGTDRFSDAMHGGASFIEAWDWWNSADNLLPYDIVLHSCEGSTNARDKSDAARQALLQYANSGGRVFLSHYHYIWLSEGPQDFRDVARWSSTSLSDTVTGLIDTTFDKGMQLADWMELTGTTPRGQFRINEARGSIRDLNDAIATRWVYLRPGCNAFEQIFGCNPNREIIQYFSFNAPVHNAPENQCGRVVFSDIHVSADDTSSPNTPFPSGCTTQGLTPQEKALVFMLFDLSRCVVPDKI